jgi:hypothetical protein
MGATWVMTQRHILILLPPFDFDTVKGVFPYSQGIKINDRPGFTALAETIRDYLGMGPFRHLHWERDRNRICDRIDELLKLNPQANDSKPNENNKPTSRLPFRAI